MSLSTKLAELAGKASNEIDVLIECALFKPDAAYKAVRSNSAGTKCIYTMADGSEVTCWAPDWTINARSDPAIMETLKAMEARNGE